MDMKLTKFLPFGMKLAASILTFSCESSRNLQKNKSSRICRDRSPAMCPPRIWDSWKIKKKSECCSTLKWPKKQGLGTKMDMKSTKFLPFCVKMAASTLTFSCDSSRRHQKINLSRIGRDWAKISKNRTPQNPGSSGAGGRGRSPLDNHKGDHWKVCKSNWKPWYHIEVTEHKWGQATCNIHYHRWACRPFLSSPGTWRKCGNVMVHERGKTRL